MRRGALSLVALEMQAIRPVQKGCRISNGDAEAQRRFAERFGGVSSLEVTKFHLL